MISFIKRAGGGVRAGPAGEGEGWGGELKKSCFPAR